MSTEGRFCICGDDCPPPRTKVGTYQGNRQPDSAERARIREALTRKDPRMIEQTSASDRIEAARRALAEYDEHVEPKSIHEWSMRSYRLASALRALTTPPSVGLDAQSEAAESITAEVQRRMEGQASQKVMIYAAADRGFLAGIQYAHERWEPADVPSQEQMLRWLGIDAEVNRHGDLYIREQHIEREEI